MIYRLQDLKVNKLTLALDGKGIKLFPRFNAFDKMIVADIKSTSRNNFVALSFSPSRNA